MSYNSSGSGQHLTRLVPIPVSDCSRDFRMKAKKSHWIEQALLSCLSTECIDNAIHHFIDYLVTKHTKITKNQLSELKLSPKQLSEYKMAALMKAANIGIGQWREIIKCLVTFTKLDREQLTSSEYAWRKLGTDHGQIESGKVQYRVSAGKRPESIQWWTMDPINRITASGAYLRHFFYKLHLILSSAASFQPQKKRGTDLES